MSRVLKFRAWDGEKMEYCGLERAGDYHECMGHPLMQFTGMKDCFGNEVYEGDIFNRKTDKWSPRGGYIAGTSALHPENSATVVWDDGGFWVDHKPLHEFISFHSLDGHKMGVVGNIHSNPELLNG